MSEFTKVINKVRSFTAEDWHRTKHGSWESFDKYSFRSADYEIMSEDMEDFVLGDSTPYREVLPLIGHVVWHAEEMSYSKDLHSIQIIVGSSKRKGDITLYVRKDLVYLVNDTLRYTENPEDCPTESQYFQILLEQPEFPDMSYDEFKSLFTLYDHLNDVIYKGKTMTIAGSRDHDYNA